MSYQLQLLLFSENDLKLSFAYIRSSPNFVSYIYTPFSVLAVTGLIFALGHFK